MPLYGLVMRTSSCRTQPSNGDLHPARFTSTFPTWIGLIGGRSKVARNRGMSRWGWITQNPPRLYGIRSETTGTSPPTVERDRLPHAPGGETARYDCEIHA